jgi:hypothetical protein
MSLSTLNSWENLEKFAAFQSNLSLYKMSTAFRDCCGDLQGANSDEHCSIMSSLSLADSNRPHLKAQLMN